MEVDVIDPGDQKKRRLSTTMNGESPADKRSGETYAPFSWTGPVPAGETAADVFLVGQEPDAKAPASGTTEPRRLSNSIRIRRVVVSTSSQK